ncbi:hypothetical protein F7R91_14810 [Streptomyces luteolifulvus]|uniref:Uncharacterized protein n=1 Tax=Streptomyces luteolifulvus TaxID=2615112 RepID=A0A6H9UZK4_9ACTN|nr:hypothetical protein [Streptomyces luteolifulvus]KAB1146844.1 hypothetical protein F7R91_14810 [Streptomyces luteolifulvus]
MTMHRGTAVLLLEDGRELAAQVALSKDGSGSWTGRLTVPPEARTPEILNLQEGRLRINSREATFVKTYAQMDAPSLRYWMEIEGTGDAPF